MGRSLLGVWTWFAFALVSGVGFCVCLLIHGVTRWFDPNRLVTGRAIRFVGILMIRAVPAWRFEARGPFPERIPERAVCVSNHCSNLDPFLVAHLPWEMKFLAKDVLFKIPFVGWGIGIAGDIPLVRGSTSSVKRAMARAARYVRGGMPVCIFPEGTRSKDGEMLPFKDGAFRLALEEQAHVIPLAVGGTTRALRKGDWRPGRAHGVVVVGAPISTAGMTLEDLPRLKEETRLAIEELRARLRSEGVH